MQLYQIMTAPVIQVSPEENVTVAARMLEHYNIGALPVCDSNGRLCGMLTDRDLVTRCLAGERNPERLHVSEVMTHRLVTAPPDMDTAQAAALMGTQQVRRLPIVKEDRLCGIVSLSDLPDKSHTLSQITAQVADMETRYFG